MVYTGCSSGPPDSSGVLNEQQSGAQSRSVELRHGSGSLGKIYTVYTEKQVRVKVYEGRGEGELDDVCEYHSGENNLAAAGSSWV